MTHGPCPRAEHFARSDFPVFENLQGVNQFAFGQFPAPPFARQGSEGFDDEIVAGVCSEIRLDAPDGQNGPAFDPVYPFDPGQLVFKKAPVLRTSRDSFRWHGAAEVVAGGEGIFRLISVCRND